MSTHTETVNSPSTVYGPVHSWRLGWSLGVDLLSVNSVCSFRCAYCQLGAINVHTLERKIYAPTERVMGDLRASAWRRAQVITLSGSGEPTLAANMGEVIRRIKTATGEPVAVLTNATTLNDPAVRRDLCEADRVFCKLDAADEESFARINRPVAGLTLGAVVEGIKKLRAEHDGALGVQIMLLPSSVNRAEQFAEILREIGPDEAQLGVPTRPRPPVWTIEARGNLPAGAVCGRLLNPVTVDEAARFEETVRRLTGLKIVSAYRARGAESRRVG